MATLTEQMGEFLARFPSAKEVAQKLGKSEHTVKTWVKQKRYPQEAIELMLSGYVPEDEFGAPPEPEPEPAPAIAGADAGSELAEVLNDFRERIEALENQMGEFALALQTGAAAYEEEIDPRRRMPGSRIEHASMTRPVSGVPTNVPPNMLDRRRRIPSAYQAGALVNGRAPTREQAHMSSRAPRGNPAGPALPRVRKPGPRVGTFGWNDSKAKRAAKIAAAAAKKAIA